MLIRPLLKDHLLLDDIRQSNHLDGCLRLWWLGQSGFLFQWNGARVLVDPYLSDSLTAKYYGTDKPHVRMTVCPVGPARLAGIDAVCVTHHHTDHADPDTLRAVGAANPAMRIVAPAASRELIASRLGFDPNRLTGMDEGETLAIGSVRVTAIASAHETIERDEHGRCRFLGYVLRFGPWTVYHSGDTLLYEGLSEAVGPFRVHLALLPINGRGKGVPGNMTASEAVWLARAIRARWTIPCHYGMFAFNTVSLDGFREAALREGIPFTTLRCGQRWEVRTAHAQSPNQL